MKTKTLLKAAAAAAMLAGAMLSISGPAKAEIAAAGFSYDSGGYCDSDGCPDDFWDYPIAYCPVYFDGEWYRGPMYYREVDGENLYWIHGRWRENQWDEDDDGPRPSWVCRDRYGPALDIDFYLSHGFRWRNEWRERFHREHDGHHDHREWDHDHGDRGPHDGDRDHRDGWDHTQHDDHGGNDWNGAPGNAGGSNNTPPNDGSNSHGRSGVWPLVGGGNGGSSGNHNAAGSSSGGGGRSGGAPSGGSGGSSGSNSDSGHGASGSSGGSPSGSSSSGGGSSGSGGGHPSGGSAGGGGSGSHTNHP
jgi:hypothetical protein